MDDWQEAAFSNRHLHNRRDRKSQGKGKGSGIFDVRRIFGTYEVKCAAADKLSQHNNDRSLTPKLEIHGLNSTEDAIYAELSLPGVLHAVVILAGSRKTMTKAIEAASSESVPAEEKRPPAEVEPVFEELAGENNTEQSERSHKDEDSESEEDYEASDEVVENRRVQQFEKNSFRSPKFWLRWQGQLQYKSDGTIAQEDIASNSGYVVFSGNACDKFQGTITCNELEWDNVKIKGWKTASRAQKDFSLVWQNT